MLNVKIKRLSETAIMPTYGSTKAAGMDLYANLGFHMAKYVDMDRPVANYIEIPPHKTVKIGTGFSFQPPEGYCGLIMARSGLATKSNLAPANKVGLCDEDYTGEYIVALHNHGDTTQSIFHGDRIAQLMFVPYEQANLVEVTELDSTNRGDGGFGSTGT
jgi:dUTP pyrophosphatase